MAAPWKSVAAIGVLVGCCNALMLAAAPESAEPPSRDLARLVAAYEIQMKHWRWWDMENRDTIDVMSDDMIPESVTHTWTTQFMANADAKLIHLNADSKPDEFEREAIRKVTDGANEVWQRVADDTWRYVARLREKESCAACHRGPAIALDDGVTPAVDERIVDGNAILGYVSVKLVRK